MLELVGTVIGTPEMRAVFADENRLQRWLDVEAALARAQAKLGVIPREAADEITKKARAKNLDLALLKVQNEKTQHFVMGFIKEFQRICEGNHGELIHWGATAQDIVDTGLILQLRDAFRFVRRDLVKMRGSVLALAAKHKATPMIGRTHGQHALPISFGYKVAVWASELNRHVERLADVERRVLRAGAIGGAVGTLASFGAKTHEVVKLTNEELGLELVDITWHTARDRFAELSCFLAMVMGTLGKICHELVNLARTDIAEIEEPFAAGKVGSSTMPQKRNPILCESVVSLERLARVHATLSIESMVHEHERDHPAWATELTAIPSLCLLASQALATTLFVVENMTVKSERMAKNLDDTAGSLCAEAVMIKLGEKIGRQSAHEVVYHCCIEASGSGKRLESVLGAEPQVTSSLSAAEIAAALDWRFYVRHAEECVDRLLAAARSWGT